ncbi:TRAP transporter large permease [Roseovarius sp.]|uniref:TRAP transporter large permease n=1 Tax=Roseovarius sp. TaxID=1486281 RepID=UPI000C397856|nr:TRAP transporter large permease [Roseovarius sp.]MAO28341.1 C4-dicarboxylate ABC transporter [Roseovarius sp.]MAZ19909.1 C4-dicarboxylate ABC transporter [Roseovarius sp.]
MVWLVLLILMLMIFFGMPIGFALMITAAIAMLLSGIDLIMAPIQMFSGVNKVVLLAIPLFIFMGELMGATSISDRIINLARALVGWMRGGLAHVNVVTSMFMAEMSGSAVADAAVMSKIFVPSMEKQGYPRSFAAAVTATSATLGIIIPPSIPMVLYGVTTNTSIKDLFVAGIIPGLILGGAFMITSYIFARKEGHPVDAQFELPRLGRAFKAALVPLLIPVLVVGGLIGGFVTPTEAATLGVVAALIYGWPIRRDLDFRRVYGLASATVRQTSVVMMIIAGSAVLGQYLANEQIPQKIASGLGGLTDSFILRMLLINIFLLLLGMFLHASAAIIVVVPMLLPLSREMGIDPVHFGVIVCLNLGIGQQTPPVASVLLTVCSATGLKIEQVMGYCKWFILAMFVTLMIVSFTPLTALALL